MQAFRSKFQITHTSPLRKSALEITRLAIQNDPSMSWKENSLDEAAAFVRTFGSSPHKLSVSSAYDEARYLF